MLEIWSKRLAKNLFSHAHTPLSHPSSLPPSHSPTVRAVAQELSNGFSCDCARLYLRRELAKKVERTSTACTQKGKFIAVCVCVCVPQHQEGTPLFIVCSYPACAHCSCSANFTTAPTEPFPSSPTDICLCFLTNLILSRETQSCPHGLGMDWRKSDHDPPRYTM